MFENVTITQEQFDDIIKKHLMWRSNHDTGQRATLFNCLLKNIHYKGSFPSGLALCFMINCTFDSCTFESCDICSNLDESEFINCTFNHCSFTLTSLYNGSIEKSAFNKCYFNNVNLNCTRIDSCVFENCCFENTNFSQAPIKENIFTDIECNDCYFTDSIIEGNTGDECFSAPSIVPECGSFIGWKKCFVSASDKTPVIVKLEILEDSKRSSGTKRKCRCEKAKVISITSIDGETSYDVAYSYFDKGFVYRVGDTVKSDSFDDNRFATCSSGIHFFLTRQEAEDYNFT